MGRIKVEILSGIGDVLDRQGLGHLILEETIAEDSTISDLLKKLARQYQAFGDIVFDGKTGNLSGYVAIALNDQLMEALAGLDTRVKDGDIIKLFAVISGG